MTNHTTTHDNSKALLESLVLSVQTECSRSDASRTFLSGYIGFLGNWLERLNSPVVRVGIIGVTSSGKSTLLNRILGQDLLPCAVRPSSGVQVECHYGPTRQAELYFEGNRTPDLRTGNLQRLLSDMADEKYNPGNRKGIREIKLYSPDWRLDRNIVLIDTPGLDAFNLGHHEEITMLEVIPTVDMVMYLTTTKADSDRQNLEYIDRATSDAKPLVVVQNKIDSVEPKISRNVEVPVEEVRKEHRERLQKLLDRAAKRPVRRAPIVQVSAKQGFKEGNLDELARVLARMSMLNQEQRTAQLIRQLQTKTGDIRTQTEIALKDQLSRDEELRRRKENLSTQRTHVELARKQHAQSSDTVEQKARAALEMASAIQEQLSRKSREITASSERNEIVASIKKLEQEMDSVLTALKNAIAAHQSQVGTLCGALNMMEMEVTRREELDRIPTDISIPYETKQEQHEERVEKDGPFQGNVARFFGRFFHNDWGYETVTFTENVEYIDAPRLLSAVGAKAGTFSSYIDSHLGKFKETAAYTFAKMDKALDAQAREIQDQHTTELDSAEVTRILELLNEIMAIPGADRDIQNAESPKDPRTPPLVDVELRPLHYALYEYARRASFAPNHAFIGLLTEEAGSKGGRIGLLGWDARLVDRFHESFLISNPYAREVEWYVEPGQDLHIGVDLLFVLVNAAQSGSAEGKIHALRDCLRSFRGRIVWVMDSISEAVDLVDPLKDKLIEHLMELIRLGETVSGEGKLFRLMANHHNLYYSVLFNELYHESGNWVTDIDLQEQVRHYNEQFHITGERKHHTVRYIRDYRDRMTKEAR